MFQFSPQRQQKTLNLNDTFAELPNIESWETQQRNSLIGVDSPVEISEDKSSGFGVELKPIEPKSKRKGLEL